MKNKKGQLDFPILTLVILIFGLLIIAPVVLKIFVTTQESIGASLGNVTGGGGEVSATNFNTVMNTAINFWDKVMIAAFVIGVLLMLLSAFFIDTHPVWIVLYVFIMFMLILFAPNIIGALDVIYNSATFASEVSRLTFMDFLRTHFGEFLVGLFVITGIIIYGKIRLFSSSFGGLRK